VKLLSRYLRKESHSILVVRDPGSTSISEGVRRILLNPHYKKMTPLTELFLYFASRAQLVDEIIKPALKENKVVISDRFLSSTIVYQGYAGKIGVGNVERIWCMTTGGFVPDMTIILDIPPEKGLERIRKNRVKKATNNFDRMERKALLFHKKVREGFIKLAKSDKKKYQVIDGTQSIPDIHKEIRKIADKILEV
ncbi:MAG: dTMP kinase, partial [Planctomycetota bacterium]